MSISVGDDVIGYHLRESKGAQVAQKIIIIGAGIIGSTAAYQLQKCGASVTVVDAGMARATDASFGWINASFFLNADHFRLRAEGIAAYQRLAQSLSIPLRRAGCLMWDLSGDALRQCHDQLHDFGYKVQALDAKGFHAYEPSVSAPPDQSLRFSEEAVANPTLLTHTLLAAAQALGAQVIGGVRVSGVDWQANGGVQVATDAGDMTADAVLLAAGTGSAKLCESLDIPLPMLKRPAYVVETNPLPPFLDHVLASPIGEIRQRRDGRLIIPAAVSHQADDTDHLTQSAAAAADATIDRARTLFSNEDIHWSQVLRADRPVPADELPVIGYAQEGLYVAVMHSGLTLAAITAELMAIEMLSGPTNQTNTLLASFRPDRFRGK